MWNHHQKMQWPFKFQIWNSPLSRHKAKDQKYKAGANLPHYLQKSFSTMLNCSICSRSDLLVSVASCALYFEFWHFCTAQTAPYQVDHLTQAVSLLKGTEEEATLLIIDSSAHLFNFGKIYLQVNIVVQLLISCIWEHWKSRKSGWSIALFFCAFLPLK